MGETVSCDWDIACITCSRGKPLYQHIDMGIQDANHAEEAMAAIIDEHESFEHLAEACDRQAQSIWQVHLQVNYHFINLDFFREHKGHDLHPVNEYGEFGKCRRKNEGVGSYCDLDLCVCGQPKNLHTEENGNRCPMPNKETQ